MRYNMTVTDIIPIIESLPHTDKLDLMKFLSAQLAEGKDLPLQIQAPEKNDSLWDIVGMAEGENANVARHHDEYIYKVK